jgi:ribosomal protein L11 methyltransferase
LLREALAATPVQSLLDVGCGAGLLGLAAAALGVPRVLGVDISPAAVHVTRENARENRLAGALQVVQGSTECVKGPFDLVMANLPWEVQMDKVSELDRLAGPGGRLILSGFRDNQEDLLIQRYQSLGWSLARRIIKYFWHPELPADISFTWVAWWLEPKTS